MILSLRSRLCKTISAFRAERSGAGAVEFAILFPILLMTYIASFEITVGMSVSKRVARATGAIADIVTQQQSVTPTWLADMVSVAQSTLVPYSSKGLTLNVTAVQTDGSSQATVKWSWAQSGSSPYAKNSVVTLPSDLRQPNSFFVRAEVAMPYTLFTYSPGFLPDKLRTITIKRTYYYRQRQGDTITCDTC